LSWDFEAWTALHWFISSVSAAPRWTSHSADGASGVRDVYFISEEDRCGGQGVKLDSNRSAHEYSADISHLQTDECGVRVSRLQTDDPAATLTVEYEDLMDHISEPMCARLTQSPPEMARVHPSLYRLQDSSMEKPRAKPA
jgi:hypothetical protein